MRITRRPDTWGLIGYGRVGRVLAKAFVKEGRVLRWIVEPDVSGKLPKELGNVSVFSNLNAALGDVEMVFICVPDSALPEVAKEICHDRFAGKFQYIIHTCGSMGVNALENVSAIGAEPLAWHPLQSFTNGDEANLLKGVTFGVAGSEDALEVGKQLAAEVGGKILIVPDEMRVLYHLSGVFSSSFIVAMAAIAAEFLQEIGAEPRESHEALAAIMNATVRNVIEKGATDAISGPLVRDDLLTVQKHLSALKNRPAELELYQDISRKLLKYLGKNDVFQIKM